MTGELNVEEVALPGQHQYESGPFPCVFQCESPDAQRAAITDWIHQNQAAVNDRLASSGAILFRGFGLQHDVDFDAFILAFGYENFAYKDSLSNAVRVNRTERVFTANEAPSSVNIFLHHEMAQTPIYPGRLFFFCEQAAETGGATPICRSDKLYEELKKQAPQFIADCEERGLSYTNVMPAAADMSSGMGRSWQSTLAAETKEQAEARLAKLGYTWQWLEDDSLRVTTPRLDAVKETALGKSFFNQLIAAFKGWKDDRNDPSKAITYGDGSPLDTAGAHLAAELAEQFTFDIPWQAGDVALVDNYSTMHGRRTFTGVRKVLASLTS